jgi:chemotaxis protein methyltransferase CheR
MDEITNIGIIEYRNILKAVSETHGIDFSHKSFTAFVRSIERAMALNNIRGTDNLISILTTNKNFIHRFISDISIEETEMFRDPNLWLELRDNIIPQYLKKGCNIWVPEVTSGDELITLAIVLKELDMLNDVRITATCFGRNQVDIIKEAVFPMKKMEVNIANFARYNSKLNLKDFYIEKNNKAYFDKELIRNVNVKQFEFIVDESPQNINMVLYRNKMIYYNKRMQNSILNKITDSMATGGIFVCGVKENLESSNNEKSFVVINESESIYKKIS